MTHGPYREPWRPTVQTLRHFNWDRVAVTLAIVFGTVCMAWLFRPTPARKPSGVTVECVCRSLEFHP